MNVLAPAAATAPPNAYPADHWAVLERYLTGGERDARDQFDLSADTWDAVAYAPSSRGSSASAYRFRFARLHSFLRPYVKWFCYERILLARPYLSVSGASLPDRLARADAWLLGRGICSLDELASTGVFDALWAAQLDRLPVGQSRTKRTLRQESTRPFWLALQATFGAPTRVPPTAIAHRPSSAALATDESKIVPAPVVRALVNRLALHRDGVELLNNYDLLRLCVVVLACCLGRRIGELLSAPRGQGHTGPLTSYPSTVGEAMWFCFRPSKGGRTDRAYVSSEWEDVVGWCVAELIRMSDPVRAFAPSDVADRLILVSGFAGTAHGVAASRVGPPRRRWAKRAARELTYQSLHSWLNDKDDASRPDGRRRGAMTRWNITIDGAPDGEIYRFRSHAARHTRQSALIRDPGVSRLAAQRDLNHDSREMQLAYQHALADQQQSLLARARRGELAGPGAAWIGQTSPVSDFRPGRPTRLSEQPRWQALLRDNPALVAFTRVPIGYCTLPQGPGACSEFLLCAEADEGGCRWFATDPQDTEQLIALADRAAARRAASATSADGGAQVAAERDRVLAGRAERIFDDTLSRASVEVRERVRRHLEEGSS